MKKARHSAAQIAAKLRQADELAAKGKLQTEIARALGISVMTYHRWRKAQHTDRVFEPDATGEPAAGPASDRSLGARIAELRLENSRLRRLVADLLLEKVKLEEVLQGRPSPRRRGNA